MTGNATPERAATLRRLVEVWNDNAAKLEAGIDLDAAAVLRRCAWELETVLDGKNA